MDVETKKEYIRKSIFLCYRLMERSYSRVVPIPKLRDAIKLVFKELFNIRLTHEEIDNVFRSIPFDSEKYLISWGRPMGGRKGLLRIGKTYYLTIIITWK